MRPLYSSTSPCQFSASNPYSTPSPSTYPPDIPSRRRDLDFEHTYRDDAVHSFNKPRRASMDSSTSRASSHWASSPHHSRNASISPNISPISPLYSSSHSSSSKVNRFPPDSYYDVPATATSPGPPPTERNRRSSRATPEASRQGSRPPARPPTLSVISIPPAQASDLTFDPAQKTTKKSKGSKGRGRSHYAESSSRRGDSNDRSPSPQPVKYRFVSVQEAQPSAGRVSAAPGRGKGKDRVRLEEYIEEEVEEDAFEHGPTELPPRPYPGGEYATSPFRKKKEVGRITGSNVDFLPVLEARFSRLETAIDQYMDLRAEQAVNNSILPGTSGYGPSWRSSRR